MIQFNFSRWRTACLLALVGFCVLGNVSVSLAAAPFAQLFTEQQADSFLPVDQAFKVEAVRVDERQLQLQFKVAPGHYLYRARIALLPPDDRQAELQLPAGEVKQDPNFGAQQVFHHDFVAQVRFLAPPPASFKLRYQGCSEKGLCYPPQSKTITWAQLPVASASSSGQSTTATDQTSPSNTQPATTSATATAGDFSGQLLASGHWWQIIVGFFGAGLLLSLTPCVFPMIPILSGIIVGKQAHVSRGKAFALSLAYTLGMSLTYTLAGIAAGLSGQLLSNALQTPVALVAGGLIFVLLSLSMFGWYELKLPSKVENLFFHWSNRFTGGHYLSDFLMGALSALIISPCVAAPLAGALLYISQSRDVVLGGVALFALSLGMGAPLLLIGASAGKLLPKAGAWMNTVRRLFGVLMLGVAVWIVSPLLSQPILWLCWAALCIVPAVYLRAIDPLPDSADTVTRLIKGGALMLLCYGLALLVGAWSGARSPLQPLQGLLAGSSAPMQSLVFQRVQSPPALESALQAVHGQPVMLDFYADWCVSCKEYEQFVFSDAQVQAALKGVVLLQVDVTDNRPEDAALLKQFALFGPPGIVFFDADGKRLAPIIKGYQDRDQFLNQLRNLPLRTSKDATHA